MENIELLNALQKFKTLLRKYDDLPENAFYFSDFIRYLLKIKPSEHINLPTMEIMTVIKHEKPTIFYELKKLASYNPVLDFVTNITIDKEAAIQHLKALEQQLKK